MKSTKRKTLPAKPARFQTYGIYRPRIRKPVSFLALPRDIVGMIEGRPEDFSLRFEVVDGILVGLCLRDKRPSLLKRIWNFFS